MKTQNVFALVLFFVSLSWGGAVQAQTEKTVRGQHGPTPYINHAEFQNISVGGEAVSDKSSSSQTTFKDILAVASLEEVTRHFGEPTSTEYNRFPEGMSTDYTVVLTYDGLELKYRKIMSEIKLQTMTITSEDRSLGVGGVKLRPGMSTDSLSAKMRKAIEEDGDGVVAITVARPGKSEDPRSIQDSQTEIQLWTETGVKNPTVKKVRFHRISF
jgi:hypothetical protein